MAARASILTKGSDGSARKRMQNSPGGGERNADTLTCVKDAQGLGADSTEETRCNRRKERMSHVPHELAEDFPAQADLIARLKAENAHFARLTEEYHAINRQVHRAETDLEPMDDLTQQQLRKTRMALKDDIARLLSENA